MGPWSQRESSMKNVSGKSTHLNLSFLPSFLRRRRASSHSSIPPSFEVAPGILSTDATAKVFGLDQQVSAIERPRSKSLAPRKLSNRCAYHQDTSPTERNIHPCKLCSCRVAKRLPIGSEDVPNALGRDPICYCCEEYSELGEKRPQVHRRRRSASKKRRLPRRVKDSEDYLTVQYPNPITGIMTPSVVSDSGGDMRAPPSSKLFSKARKFHYRQNSGRWRRDSHSWFNDEPTILSTIPQSRGSTSKKSLLDTISNANDRFVVKMPTAREPAPYEHPGKTSSQIEEWENKTEVETATRSLHYRLANPKSPRASEFLRKEKIQDSEDTVIINGQIRTTSAPMSGKESDIPRLIPRIPAVKILGPSSEKGGHPTQSLQVPSTRQERPKSSITQSKDQGDQDRRRILNHKTIQSSPKLPSRTKGPSPKDDIEGACVPPQQRSFENDQKTNSRSQEAVGGPAVLDEYKKALLNNLEIVEEVSSPCSTGAKDCHHRHVHHHYYLPKSDRRRRRYHSWHERCQNYTLQSKRENQEIKAKDTIAKRSLRHRTRDRITTRHSEHTELFDQVHSLGRSPRTFHTFHGTSWDQDDAKKRGRQLHIHTHVLIPDWEESSTK